MSAVSGARAVHLLPLPPEHAVADSSIISRVCKSPEQGHRGETGLHHLLGPDVYTIALKVETPRRTVTSA